MQAIELTESRVIPITDRKRTYTLTVGVITRAQWLEYFKGIVSTSESRNREVVESYDSRSARVELAEKVLISADGYRTPNDAPLTSLADWQTKIPMAHRIALADVLISVVSDDDGDEEEALMVGSECITLTARWGADESGKLQELKGLKHIFQPPTHEHQRRYQRAISRSVIVGGSRTAKTRWMGAQAVLVELYDELIQSVEGYTVNGAAPASVGEIVAAMDTFHKVVAAERLFVPVAPKVDDGEK
jgi:hypothetical protein